MRNITFDESTVLREFARIANEQQLIKTAEVVKEAGALENLSAKLQKGEEPMKAALEVVNVAWAGMANNPDKEKMYDALVAQVKQFLMSKYGKHPNFATAISNFDAQSTKIKSPIQAVDDTVKEAASKDKAYDVSGETGEQLIDSAHPGNMKTELTHSKTDQALVETIVEQQEADIAVVNKVPKGTYAALVDLHTSLSKMGYADKLNGLKNCIQSLAYPEDILNHALVILADSLDGLGLSVEANRVDQLLKKKVIAENPRAKRFLDTIKSNTAYIRGNDRFRDAMLQMLGKVNPDMTLAQTMREIKTLFDQNKGHEMYDQLYAIYTSSYNDFKDSLAQEQSEQPQPQTNVIQPVSMTPILPPLKPGGTPAVQKWQMNYNKRHGKQILIPDGVWGRATQQAYSVEHPEPVITQTAPVTQPSGQISERMPRNAPREMAI